MKKICKTAEPQKDKIKGGKKKEECEKLEKQIIDALRPIIQ